MTLVLYFQNEFPIYSGFIHDHVPPLENKIFYLKAKIKIG